MADVAIQFDGLRYTGWQSVSIRESVDDLCASVSLSCAGIGRGNSLGLTENTVISVLTDNLPTSAVRPDSVRRSTDINSHTLRIEARSLARELVDCQYSITLSGLTLGEVIKSICRTFKVPVKIAVKTAVVPTFSMQCEVPANALINAARAANLLLYPLPDGGLILTEPDNARPVATLRLGEHIKKYTITDEFKLRFSEYIVKSFDYDGNQALRGACKDAGLRYFRPMHIVADRHSDHIIGCDSRARLERDRRLARAHAVELEVAGWSHDAGLWRVNTQIRLVIPDESIDGVFLVGDRTFTLDDKGGSVTRLTVMHRNAFVGEAPARKKRSAGDSRRKKS